MPEASPSPELLRSLGRLVRGLSALFWGLPLTLVASVGTAMTDWFGGLGILPPLVAYLLLLFGLWQMGSFQRQERIWRMALHRARVLALIGAGLSPYLYWWNQVPSNLFFTGMLLLGAATGLILLISLNLVIRRLGAMLPDETLRHETRQFTVLNRNLLVTMILLVAAYLILAQIPDLPRILAVMVVTLKNLGFWLVVLLVLLPVAMTMALLWKTKEVILDSIFGGKA